MNKKIFKDQYIKTAGFICNYDLIQDIDRYAMKFEDGLNTLFNGKKVELTGATKIVDPNIPRFVLNDNKKQLSASMVSVNLVHSFITLSFSKAIEVYNNNIKQLYDYLKSNLDFKDMTLQADFTIHFPLKKIQKPLEEKIFKQLLKIDSPNKLNKVLIMYDEEKNELLYQYVMGNYEIRHLSIQESQLDKTKNNIVINPAQTRVVEKGLLVKISIQNLKKDNCSLEYIVEKMNHEIKTFPENLFFKED